MTKPKPRSTNVEYRWGIFANDEPPDVRVIHGYVTILVRYNSNDAPVSHHIMLSDADGRPMQGFLADDFPLFVSAAYAAWEELELPAISAPGGTPGDGIAPLAKIITLADDLD